MQTQRKDLFVFACISIDDIGCFSRQAACCYPVRASIDATGDVESRVGDALFVLWQWCITSSDGSRLFIDGDLVVNNDGVHGSYMRCEHKHVNAGNMPLSSVPLYHARAEPSRWRVLVQA
jgi:hypothetical protein